MFQKPHEKRENVLLVISWDWNVCCGPSEQQAVVEERSISVVIETKTCEAFVSLVSLAHAHSAFQGNFIGSWCEHVSENTCDAVCP